MFAKGLEFEGGEFRYSSRSDPLTRKTIPKSVANTKSGLDEATKKAADALQTQTRFEATVNRLTGKLNELTSSLNSVRVPFATGSRTRQPIPASQFFEVYGSAFPFEVAYRANQALGSEIAARGYAHLPDVQSFLKTEIDAAYRLLAHDTERAFWDRFCTEEMAHLIHSRNGVRLKNERDEFRRMFQQVAESQGQPDPERQGEYSSTAAFVWAMLLDAALLNTRLVQDLKETASAKGLVLACDRWPAFYLPDPPAEARAAFAQYVKARWPIHVFALDPETNDQNIADALSLRRESQFALALAFAGGQINANQFNRYVRRLEGEYETVALNRTQVGFSHGENTFGWRFYPRFQTPATRGNLTVIARDQLWGGPTTNQLLRERRLEPGPRECTALVIMPSFVPNVTLDVAGNWFALANPKHKVFDHTQALHLSRTVQAIRTDGCGVKDAHKYRDTDHRLLLARAEQLSARLPLQAMAAQVPTNDNLSGFELFVNGASSLAPQLYGWYGAPGVKEGEDTTLFLVGDHFSVTQTRVLAGNREVPTDRRHMISRQVMQVTVPWNAIPRENNHVQINVATPYGVSQELVVPVVPKAADPPAAVSAPITAEIVYDKKGAGDGSYWLDYPRAGAKAVAWLQWPDATSPPDKVDAVLTFKAAGCNLTVELKGLAVHGGLVPLDRKQLELVADQLFRGFNGLRPSTDDTNPLANGLTTDSVRLLPRTLQGDGTLSSPDANKAKASATQLTLTFRCRVPVPPERLPNPRPGDGAADVGGAFEKGPSKNTPNSPVPMQNLPPGDLPNPPVLKTTPLPAPQANPVPASPIPTPTPVPGPVTPPPPDLPAIPLAPAGDLVPPAEPSAGQRPPVLPIPRKEG